MERQKLHKKLKLWSKAIDRGTYMYGVTKQFPCEIDAQIEISHKLDFIDAETNIKANERLSEVEQLLNGLIRSIRDKSLITNH